MAASSWLLQATALAIFLVLSRLILIYRSSPLNKLPGPFIARFTNLWRLWNHYRQKHVETQRELHEKHGDIVRLGPTTVSLADPSLVKLIYNTRGTFVKSSFYSVNDALSNGHIIQNIFSTRSNEFNARSKKPIHKLYGTQNALNVESLMDDGVRVFCTELERRYITAENGGKTCDMADWISFFAWDFLGHVTWSKRIGFMENGGDVGGMLQTAENVMRYFSVVGQFPVLDKWLGKNPYWPSRIYKFDDFSVAAGFSVERFMERVQNLKPNEDNTDFLNGFLNAKQDFPDLVGDHDVIGYMIINVLGGADTLAIVIKAIFYHLLKNPPAKAKLVAELRDAKLSFPAPYKTLEQLPYLNACILEGLRFHPVLGHIVERVVPETGLKLSESVVLPPGTIVGMNPWVVHFRKDVFGADADSFKPERWLHIDEKESTSAFQARIKRMKEADMSFGGGNRICLGRPLALVELYKLVATIFGRFEIELEDPSREWQLNKQWFVWPHDIRVKLRLA